MADLTVVHVVDRLDEVGPEAGLAALVAELDRQQLARSVVVTAAGDEDSSLIAGLRSHAEAVVSLRARHAWDPRLTAAIVRVCRRHGADVIHSQPGLGHVHARAAGMLLHRPHVTTLHDPPHGDADARPSGSWLGPLASARVVAPSNEIASAYARAHRIAPRRLRVVASAPPALPVAAAGELRELRSALRHGGDAPLVLTVARLEARQGLADLVEATRRLLDTGIALHVAIAGDGPERGALAELVRNYGLEDDVTLLGHRGDIGSLLAATDVFCLPPHRAGVPPILLEALAAGLPCVATRVGGIPELIAHGRTGLLVPPGDPVELGRALKRALRHPVFAEHLGEAARRAAGGRTPRALARDYAELYREVVPA